MILRKPYAFFIRHFKLFHIILSAMLLMILYQFTNILSFFNEYMASSPKLISKEVVPILFKNSIVVYISVIVLFTTVIMSLMQWKKKPITFYALFILTILGSSVVLYYSYKTTIVLETGIVAVRTLRNVRDLLLLSTLLQFVCLIILIIRGLGFDIKKFDFGHTMLKVNESDREEFEFDITFDSDKFKRNLRRNFRNIKYTYKENRLLVNLISLFVIGSIMILIYLNINVYNKKYKENQLVSIDGYTFGVQSSYYTKRDYYNNVIENNSAFLILNIKIKENIEKNSSFDLSNFSILIGDKEYEVDESNNDKLFDLGTIYSKQDLTPNFVNYNFIFKIPIKDINKKMILVYKTNNGKTVKFKIKPENIDKEDQYFEYNIKDEITFNNFILKNQKILISEFDIQDKYRLDYNFCIDNNCRNSYQYLYKSISGNYDQTILKLNYNYEYDEKDKIVDIYSILDRFATIIYTVDDKEYKITSFNELKPQNLILKNTLFIEVDSNIKNASSIYLNIKNRNINFEYKLK